MFGGNNTGFSAKIVSQAISGHRLNDETSKQLAETGSDMDGQVQLEQPLATLLPKFDIYM